jgi:hypothetical protein
MPCWASTRSYSIFDWQQCRRTGTFERAPGSGRAAQQLGRRGLDPVGRQHRADQAAGRALIALAELNRGVEFGEPRASS